MVQLRADLQAATGRVIKAPHVYSKTFPPHAPSFHTYPDLSRRSDLMTFRVEYTNNHRYTTPEQVHVVLDNLINAVNKVNDMWKELQQLDRETNHLNDYLMLPALLRPYQKEIQTHAANRQFTVSLDVSYPPFATPEGPI